MVKPLNGKAEEKGAPPGETPAESFVPFKALHHLPRGKNTWNPAILKEWWFWPACVAGLAALNFVAYVVREWLM
ncbi:hypothetical protein [Desulfovibrio psychrotolerans]|uniref:Uncharacterized protein n=1 Tax=Desulfovibrio psychrotolerans TaxID=415242 RepID=A0A7J0BTJ3_9BACT|nr:hypothetical protein [Desulfovibrio psychrotolerans]GFM37040.1 hypothetical protein DSM19430T_17240 [Desulfovibrio psychrotolerans]